MRAFRSPRKSAIRATAVAASGVIAMAMLVGCNDDDKDKSLTPPPAPTFSIPKIDIPDIDMPDMPSNLPTGTKRPTETGTKRPTATDTGNEVEAVKLSKGECVDLDSRGEITKTSCSGSHSGEVGGVATLPESPQPDSPTFDSTAEAKCEDMVGPIIDRQTNADDLSFSYYTPTPESWENNDRTLQCIIVRADKGKLTGKLR
ncbi:septum formation family protein [Yinghuangia sp. YIM S09857]|uniref:septum formation family protein n=1 Tax=Yinghuangia sp. YIM S09857 TaxID=3436929 RepID=UPI003F52953B